MSTDITSENGVEIQVRQLGVGVVHPEGISSIWARLTSEQRKAMAAALDPDRATGGQWTRDDLPSGTRVISLWLTEESRGESADAVLDTVVEHLNVHHPKPVPYDQGGWPKPGTPEQLVRMCNDADLKRVHAEDARDAAVARAERAEKEKLDLRDELVATQEHGAKAVHERDELRDDAVNHAYWVANQLGCHVDYLDGLTLVEMAERVAEKAERERDEALDRAGNLAVEVQTGLCLGGLPRVTRADVEKAIGSCHVVRRFLDDVTMVSVPDAIDSVCKELGIEAEQAVDPVEAKAEELYGVLNPLGAWDLALDDSENEERERYRRLAAHVLGQEADQ